MPLPSASLRKKTEQTGSTLVALFEKIASGDHPAFATLYQATHLKLFGVALRILKQKHLAEDVLQDAYIKIWDHAGSFDPARGSAIAWMVAIVRNRALDEVRSGPHLVYSEEVAGMENIADLAPLASTVMESDEAEKRLSQCLMSIEEEKRNMILLAYHFGHSREMLAQQFGHPVATIKTWLRRSLETLRNCLDS